MLPYVLAILIFGALGAITAYGYMSADRESRRLAERPARVPAPEPEPAPPPSDS